MSSTHPELIEGTSLPYTVAATTLQPEGRGTPVFAGMHPGGPSMLERIAPVVEPHELAIAAAALRAYDRSPKLERTIFDAANDQTDGTTGNLLLQLFEVPAGSEGRLTNVAIDAPNSAFSASAPFSSATAWAFLAKGSPTNTDNDSFAATLRPGLLAFAPTSVAGPWLPGQWTFTDDQAPVAFGGQMFYLCIIGASVATLLNITVRAAYRVNLWAV